MKAKIRGEKWVTLDRVYGDEDDGLMLVVILNEGFDGLRIGIWCDGADEDATEILREEADPETLTRFDVKDVDGLFHAWEWTSEVLKNPWTCPHDWLHDKVMAEDEPIKLRTIIRELMSDLSHDQIQDRFQGEMDDDGYFA